MAAVPHPLALNEEQHVAEMRYVDSHSVLIGPGSGRWSQGAESAPNDVARHLRQYPVFPIDVPGWLACRILAALCQFAVTHGALSILYERTVYGIQ